MVRYLYTSFFMLFLFIGNAEAEKAKTVCVNMIIKDETEVICRCLGSLKPLIDYWVIVDTGSTDGTQQMVKEFMKDIPGELHERPWKNFGHNRNEALELAKGKADYILIIDADEVFAFTPDFKWPDLDKDFYHIITEFGGTNYGRVQLINNKLDWKWVGVLHEALDCPQAFTCDTVPNIKNVVSTDGARSKDPRKFHKDAEILEAALKEEPNNSRYMFYLAQSYRDAGEYQLSLFNYLRRIAMGGWDQEIFWSMLQVGILQAELKISPEIVLDTYKRAFEYRPTRAEPLYHLANYERLRGNYLGGYQAALRGLNIPISDDILFVDRWVYDWGLLLEFSVSAYWIEKYTEALLSSNLLLANPSLPENVRECVERNLTWIHMKIKEQQQSKVAI